MDREFNREFKECGGCPEDTIGEQWKQIKVQLSSGQIPKEQGKIMEGHEVTWAWLQEKGQIPGDEKQAKLLPYLADAERAVLRELERHKAEEGKQSWKTKGKWRAELEKKERRRASVHIIALASAALEAQKDKNKPRTVTKTVTASPTGPTTPDLYPDLKSLWAHAASDNTDQIKTPPQYTVSTPQGIQAPVINVRGGMLDLETDIQETEAATRQQWESLVQDQSMTISAATKELKEKQEELEVLRQETRKERAGRHTGQTTGYELGQDLEERIVRARWGGTTPNPRGRIGGRGRRATRTQAGARAPVAITTRGSNGTKSQLSDGPASPDSDLAKNRGRGDMSPFELKEFRWNLRQTAQAAVQTEDSDSLDEEEAWEWMAEEEKELIGERYPIDITGLMTVRNVPSAPRPLFDQSREETEKIKQDEQETMPPTTRTTRSQRQREDDHVMLGAKGKECGIPSAYAMPLVAKGDGRQVYQPFSFTDMNAILEKMPSPTAGGRIWMDRFSQLTNGWNLCLGDWRGLIGHQLPTHEQQRIELAANTINTPDDQLFCPMATRLGRVMRDIYPVEGRAVHSLAFALKEKETVPEFLIRCGTVWTEIAGSHPTIDKLQTSLFRKAIIEGMPKAVQGKMRENPDLLDCHTDKWEKHLNHYVRQEEEKQKDLESEQATKKAQLLNIQLETQRRMLNEFKKPLKQSSQMLQQPRAQQGQLQQQPMVPPAPAYPPVQDMYAQPPRQTGRGGYRGRGRGNRPRNPPDQCYACGRTGHWARHCPTPPQNYDPQRRDVRYQAPNPAAAPRGQYHLNAHDDNPVHEWGEDSHYHQGS